MEATPRRGRRSPRVRIDVRSRLDAGARPRSKNRSKPACDTPVNEHGPRSGKRGPVRSLATKPKTEHDDSTARAVGRRHLNGDTPKDAEPLRTKVLKSRICEATAPGSSESDPQITTRSRAVGRSTRPDVAASRGEWLPCGERAPRQKNVVGGRRDRSVTHLRNDTRSRLPRTALPIELSRARRAAAPTARPIESPSHRTR